MKKRKKPTTYLITGSTGFIGKNLSKYISLKKNCKIINVPRKINLSNEKITHEYFKKIKNVNYIFHLADVSGNKEWSASNSFYQTLNNVKIHMHVIESWKLYHPNAKFVFVSSIWAYPIGKKILNEQDYWKGMILNKTRHYGYSKKIATILIETAKKDFNLNGTTLVLGTVFGPGDNSDHFIPTIIRKMIKEKINLDIMGTGKESRDFIYIDDQIKAIYAHKDVDLSILNIGSGRLIKIKEVINILKDKMVYSGNISYQKNNTQNKDSERGMNIKRANLLTGWPKNYKLKNLTKALKLTIEDIKKNG